MLKEEQNIDGKWEVVSYSKNGDIIDIRNCNTETEAKNLEFTAESVNIINKASESVKELSAEGIDNVNAYYQKSPEKLIALTEAIAKPFSQTTASDRVAIREFNKLVNKEVKIKEQENEKLQSEKAAEAELQAKKVGDTKEVVERGTESESRGIETIETEKPDTETKAKVEEEITTQKEKEYDNKDEARVS